MWEGVCVGGAHSGALGKCALEAHSTWESILLYNNFKIRNVVGCVSVVYVCAELRLCVGGHTLLIHAKRSTSAADAS